MTTWTDVDEPLLRWLLDREDAEDWNGRVQLNLRPEPEPQTQIGQDLNLDARQVDEGLQRLRDHGLIAGERGETVGYAYWSQLRLCAVGLIVLGEWPDLDRVASFTGLQALIAALAEQNEDPEDKSTLRRTAGAIGRLGEGVVDSTIESVATDLGGQL